LRGTGCDKIMQVSLQKMFEDFLNKSSIFINKEALTIKYTPETIPHRDAQISQVAQIMAPALRLEKPSNLFIYGKTGSGKTICVKHVCSQLELVAQSKKIPLKIIYVNCKMRKVADTEYRLIAHLARAFGKEVPPTGLPTDEVYKIFYEALDSEKRVVLIVLDEIDKLVEKCGDEILYNLTRMNSDLNNAKICIIGISNDITFKSKLDPRVKSSLSEEELIFPPYDALQLKDILSSRAEIAFVKGSVDEVAIAKCAAYAAREHGDARRALDLLRVAGELAERESATKVTEKHIDAADEKIERDQTIELIKNQPKQSLAVFYAIIMHDKSSKKDSSYTGEVFDLYKDICLQAGIKHLTQRRVSDLIGELDMLGVINAKVISKGRYGRTREISLNIPSDTLLKVEEIIKQSLNI